MITTAKARRTVATALAGDATALTTTTRWRLPWLRSTLTQRQLNASVAAPVPIEVLAGGKPTTPVILALDLGQRTGWAVRNRDGAIASGVQEFRPGRFEGGGMIWLRFRAWLREVDETSGGVGVVVFEEVRRHLGTAAAHAYGGYLAHLTAWAEANRIPYQGVPVGTIKRHVTGKGNADKQAVIEAVRRLGFAPADDNEADALALLNWAIAHGVGVDPMNGAMLLQHAAGVDRTPRAHLRAAGGELRRDRRALVAGARDHGDPGAGGAVPDRSEAGAAHPRSVASRLASSMSPATPRACGR